MRQYLIAICLGLYAAGAAADIALNFQCGIKEYSSGLVSKHDFELKTLSDNQDQSISFSKNLAIDSSAIYLLSLTKGQLYMDAVGDEIGADYYISLVRVQNKIKSQIKSDITKGITQDMATLTIKEGLIQGANYRTVNGNLVNRMPKKLQLNYKMNKNRIQVKCNIL